MRKQLKNQHPETSYCGDHIRDQDMPTEHKRSGITLPKRTALALGTLMLAGLSLSAGFPTAALAQATEACSGKLYAATSYSDAVSVIDTQSNAIITTISVGHHPAQMVFTPDHKQIYVTNSGETSLSVIDVATNAVVKTIPLDDSPLGIAITPDGKRLALSSEKGQIKILTLATNESTPPIAVKLVPEQIRMTPDGKYLYVLSFLASQVEVIDVDKAQIIATIPIKDANGGIVPAFPYNGLMSSDGKTLYVAALFDNFMAVIDTTSNAIVNTWPATSPVGIQSSPDHTKLYITNYYGASSISEYDAATGELLRNQPLNVHKPAFMALREDGKYLYIGQAFGKTLTVFDTDTWTVKKELKVGKGANALLICNSPSPPS